MTTTHPPFHIAPDANDALGTQFAYPDLLTLTECQTLIAMVESPEDTNNKLVTADRLTIESSATTTPVSIYPDSDHQWLFIRLRELVDLVNQHYKFNLNGIFEALQLSRLSIGEHRWWHNDLGDGLSSNRKLAIVIHLSEPNTLEGGTLQVIQNDKPVDCEWTQGSATIMPAYEVRRVTPVEKGNHYTLTGWVSGPAFK